MSAATDLQAKFRPAPKAVTQEFEPPGIDPTWQNLKTAQLREIQLRRRMETLVPTMVALIVGIGFGASLAPFALKCIIVGIAAFVAAYVVGDFKSHEAKTTALYQRIRPDHIKLVAVDDKEEEEEK